MNLSSSIPVAVLYYGKPTLTMRCIHSILATGHPPERIFCLDNGSGTDSSGQIREAFPHCLHHSLEENRGFSGGFNAAVNRVASSGYDRLLFLTNDTELTPHTLNGCETIATQRNAQLVAPSIRLLRRPGQVDSLGARFHPENALLSHLNDPDDDSDLKPPFEYIPGTAFWLRVDAFQLLKGMDESFHTYWEDVDFSLRAHSAGLVLARAPEATILHAVGRTCHGNPLYSTFYFQRNRIRFCRRHLAGKTLDTALTAIRNELERRVEIATRKQDNRRLKLLETVILELNSP